MATKHFLGGRIILGTEFAGYKYRIFEAGTSTPKTSYKDSALTVGNENSDPITLDANGACQIWFNGNAKAVFYTSADVVVYTDDNVNLESSTSSAGSFNAALNGSFEDDADGDGIPDNWTRTLYTGGAFTLDTTVQNHGDTSAKFTSTGTGGGYLTSTAKFPVVPSEPYELSWDMRSSDAGVRNLIQIFWYKADGTASATASSTALDDSTTNQTSWARETYNTAAPNDAYFAEIRLTGCHSSDATTGSTWFDNVQFLHAKSYGYRINAGINSFSSGLGPGYINNIKGAFSVASNQLTFSIVGNDGNACSSTNIGELSFPSATATDSAYVVSQLTAAASVVVPDTALLGTSNNTVARIWGVVFYDAGTWRPGVINCSTSTQVFSIADDAIASSTAVGTGSDSAGVFYTTAAVTSKPYRIIAYCEISEATAGTWATAATKQRGWRQGMKLPGDRVQFVFATKTSQFTTGSASFTDITGMSVSITPTSSVNKMKISSPFSYGNNTGGEATYIQLVRDSTAINIGDAASNRTRCSVGGQITSAQPESAMIDFVDAPATTSSTTYKLQMKVTNGTGTFNSSGTDTDSGDYGRQAAMILVEEIMG